MSPAWSDPRCLDRIWPSTTSVHTLSHLHPNWPCAQPKPPTSVAWLPRTPPLLGCPPCSASRSPSRMCCACRACLAPAAPASSKISSRRTTPPPSQRLLRRGGGGAARPTRTNSPWVPRPRTRPTLTDAQSVGPGTRAGRLVAAAARRRGGAHGACGAGHRHRRQRAPAGCVLRCGRAQALLRARVALRAGGVRVRRSTRWACLARSVEDVALLLSADRRARSARLDVDARPPVPDYAEADGQPDLHGLRVGVPEEYFVEGMQPEVEQAVRHGVSRRLAALGASVREVSAAAHRVRAAGLLPHRAGRGLGQPGALRRRALRPACSRRDHVGHLSRTRAARALARRSSGASCWAPTRSQPVTTTPTTSRRRRCAR